MKLPSCVLVCTLFWTGWAPVATAESASGLPEHVKAMLKDAEEMVMHGGMGDARAIVHHCGEVTRHAEALLQELPPSGLHGKEAIPYLKEAIRYCEKVASIGDQVDPGVTLNPATKARAAAREAAKHLAVMEDSTTRSSARP